MQWYTEIYESLFQVGHLGAFLGCAGRSLLVGQRLVRVVRYHRPLAEVSAYSSSKAIGWILLAQVVGAPLLLTRYVLGQPKRVLFERLTRGGKMRETFDITFICGHSLSTTTNDTRLSVWHPLVAPAGSQTRCPIARSYSGTWDW